MNQQTHNTKSKIKKWSTETKLEYGAAFTTSMLTLIYWIFHQITSDKKKLDDFFDEMINDGDDDVYFTTTEAKTFYNLTIKKKNE